MKIIFQFCISLLFAVVVSCQEKPASGSESNNSQNISNDTISNIDNYLTGLAKEKGFSGGLLIIKNGKKILSKGYGFADKGNGIAFSPTTLASIGSITKAFTATAIMKLHEQGKLGLKDPLKKFFPDIPIDKANITIHQLLTHSSGFSELLEGDNGDYEKIETQAYLKRAFKQPLRFEPGTKAIYTNVGMSLLGIIIEQVSGMDYEKYLRKELFEPIGIKHIGYQYPIEKGIDIAHGYKNGTDWGSHQSHFESAGGGPYWNLKANGGLEASLDEIYLWANAFTNKKILSAESIETIFTPHIVEENTNGHYHFGYGCNTETSRRNTKVIDNGGSNGIYFARLVRYPQEGIVFYMVTNEQTIPTPKVLPNVQQMYFYGKIERDAMSMENRFENLQAENIYKLIIEKGPEGFEQNLVAAGIQIEDDMVLLEAGQKLMDDKKNKEGIALFEFYVKKFPKIVVAKNNLGDLYRESGNKEKAIECYQAALKVRPGNPRAIEELKKLGVK